MPTILLISGFRFFFYSNEGSEPIHIHVEKAGGNGKIWLEPVIKIAYMRSFSTGEQRYIKEIIEENEVILKQKWNEFFGQ